jgi:rod shape-determining protein MreB
MRRNYHLDIGVQTAEHLKIELGNVLPNCPSKSLQIEGTDAATRTPRVQEVNTQDIRDALMDHIDVLMDAIREVMGHTPPELLADIVEGGVLLTGGASLLGGLDQYLRDHLGVSVQRAKNPMTSVAIGAAQALDDPALAGCLMTQP